MNTHESHGPYDDDRQPDEEIGGDEEEETAGDDHLILSAGTHTACHAQAVSTHTQASMLTGLKKFAYFFFMISYIQIRQGNLWAVCVSILTVYEICSEDKLLKGKSLCLTINTHVTLICVSSFYLRSSTDLIC